MIEDSQARLAKSWEAQNIAGQMIRLCADFNTPMGWNPREQCLDVDFDTVPSVW